MKKVVCSNSISTLAGGVFAGCTKLREFYAGENLTAIDASVFENCYDITFYGKKGSYIEQFAVEQGFEFVEITE